MFGFFARCQKECFDRFPTEFGAQDDRGDNNEGVAINTTGSFTWGVECGGGGGEESIQNVGAVAKCLVRS